MRPIARDSIKLLFQHFELKFFHLLASFFNLTFRNDELMTSLAVFCVSQHTKRLGIPRTRARLVVYALRTHLQ